MKLNVSDDENKNDPDAMAEMLTKCMIKEDVDGQYDEIFPEGHQTFFKNQKSFDFSEIIQAITASSEEDVQKALDLEQPNNTVLWRALQKFRKAFTELSKKETVWNPLHLIEAFNQYDKQYNQWSASFGVQQDLFWRQCDRLYPAFPSRQYRYGFCTGPI